LVPKSSGKGELVTQASTLGATHKPTTLKPGRKLLRPEEKQVPAALFVSGTKGLAAARMIAAAEWVRQRRLQMGITQTEAADDLGIPLRQLATYEAVANWPDEARDFVKKNSARIRVSALTRQIANRKWASKATLMMALRRLADGTPMRRRGASRVGETSADVLAVEERLRDRLQTRVKLETDGVKGRVVISFQSVDELERVLGLLEG
jgi:transcriptional regulator with XRE-family HTH domain